MARLFTSGFELNSLTSGVEWDSLLYSPTIDISTVRSGLYSLKVDGNEAVYHDFASTNQTSPFYLRFYVRIASNYNDQGDICGMKNSAGANRVAIRINTDRTLELWDEYNSVQVGSDSSVLDLDTWYRIELKVDTTTIDSTSIEARINGTAFASGSISLSTGIAKFFVGNSFWGITTEVYFDDVAFNDSSGSYQNSWCGSGSVVHFHPDSAGDNNNCSSGTYADVDEVTPDDSTTIAVLDADNDILDVGCGSYSDAGLYIGDSITLVQVGVREAAAGIGSESWVLRIKSQTNGTVLEGTTTVHDDITYRTNGDVLPRNYTLTSYVDPQNGGSWTTALLNTMQIGVRAVDATPDINVSTLWALVEYVPLGYTTSTTTSLSTSSSTSTSSTTTSQSTSTSISTSTTKSTSTSSTTTSKSTSTSTTKSTTTSKSTSTSISTSTSSTTTSTSTTRSTSSSTSTTQSTSTSSTTTSSSTSTSQSTSTSTTFSMTTSTSSTTTSSSTTKSTSTTVSTSTSSTTTSSSTSLSTSTSVSTSTSSTTTSKSTSTSQSTSTTRSTSTTCSTSTSSTTTSSSTSTSISTSTSSTTTSSSTTVSTSTSTTESTSTSLSTSTSSTTTSSSTTISTSSSTSTSSTTTSSSTTESTSTSLSTSTSSTTTSTSSTTTSTSTTTTLAPSGGLAFGEQYPLEKETAVSWKTWSDGAGSTPTISGDADWGSLTLSISGSEGRSGVCDLLNDELRQLTVTTNRYGAGSGTVTIYIRGDSSIFGQDDETPDWETYTTSISRSWRYVQIRLVA